MPARPADTLQRRKTFRDLYEDCAKRPLMRCLIMIFALLVLACSKKDAPPPADVSPAATAETEAPLPAVSESKTAGAGSPFDQAERPVELQVPAPPLSEPPSFKVLEPGSNPSRELKWNVKPGFEQTLSMKIGFDIEANVGGLIPVEAPSRSTVYKIKLKAQEVEPGGALRVAFVIDEVNAQYEKGTVERHLDRLRKSAAEVRGLRGSFSAGSSGWVRNVELDAPPHALREAHDMVDNLKWAFYQMTPSFPEGVVGEGTKWTVHRGVSQGGIPVNQLSMLEITKLEGARVDVKIKFQQAAYTQTFESPGLEVPMELLGLIAEGGAEVSWDPTLLAPRTAGVRSIVQRLSRYEKDGKRADTLATTTRTLAVPAE